MNNKSMDVLSHLKYLPKDVVTFQVSPYSVALEGWRRGLTLKFINADRGHTAPSNAIHYSLSDGKNEYTFACARGSMVSREAIEICINKSKTYTMLHEKGIPIPKGQTFKNHTTIDVICDYANTIGFPLVVKATNLGGGKGVFANITNEKDLVEAVNKLRIELKRKEIIVEQFITGFDYRFYVVGDKVSAVSKYFPLNIVGNGVNNIEQLISFRNKQFKLNKVFRTRNIIVDTEMLDYLGENNYSLKSIPVNGERVFLRKQGTYIGSRLPVDVTDDVSEELKSNAIKAIKAIEGLHHGSVDMIVNEETGEGFVNEVNSRGEISLHLYPIEGLARDVPKDIIDFYFPDHKEIKTNFYFEFKPIKEMFLAGYAQEIVVPRVSQEEYYKKEFELKGYYLGPVYMKWLRREAARLKLIGKIEKNRNRINNLKITVIGNKEEIFKLENTIKEKGTQKSKVTQFFSTDFSIVTTPNNISFEIVED